MHCTRWKFVWMLLLWAYNRTHEWIPNHGQKVSNRDTMNDSNGTLTLFFNTLTNDASVYDCIFWFVRYFHLLFVLIRFPFFFFLDFVSEFLLFLLVFFNGNLFAKIVSFSNRFIDLLLQPNQNLDLSIFNIDFEIILFIFLYKMH